MKITQDFLNMLHAELFRICDSNGNVLFESYDKTDIFLMYRGYEVKGIQADYEFSKVDGFEAALNIWVQ